MPAARGPAVPHRMRAMRMHAISDLQRQAEPLVAERIPLPELATGELLVEVHACGVCRTEIDEIEGRTPPPVLPMTPGHQAVGTVIAEHPGCRLGLHGQRVGVAWIHSSCGKCAWCRQGLENLCPRFRATGRDAPGGYAEFLAIHEDFAHPLPPSLESTAAAPLLCAGAVGLRALRSCQLGAGEALGLTGFGASGHLVLQMARFLHPDSALCVFARDPTERSFALELGADWAGDIRDPAPQPLAAVIDTTPAWTPVVAALAQLAPGGRLVINAIRKQDRDQAALLELRYEEHLWREKSIRSVANVTRADVRDCLELAARIPLTPEVACYALEDANRALCELTAGALRGAKVLVTARPQD